jgi:outer membrane protein assembly factor BamB
MEQLLRLIDSVYRLPTDAEGNRLPNGAELEPAWQKAVSQVSVLKIKWDPRQNIYVFQNGTHLPQVVKKNFRRQIWKLNGLGFDDAELVLERKNDDWVDVTVSYTESPGVVLRPATLFLFDIKDTKSPWQKFSFPRTVGTGGGGVESNEIDLKADSEITAKLMITGYQTNSSPIFVP